MNDELRDRREETYRMLIAHGRPQSEVVARLSDQHDVTKDAIRKDIKQMTSWLPKLSVDFGEGIIRLTRLRDQQQELEVLALQAQRDDDLNAAIRARQEIRKAITAEDQMASRLGLTPDGDEEAWEPEFAQGLDPEDEELLDEFCRIDEHREATDLKEHR